ncbi:unnamed protein product [Polarella glacialis]|uniref:N-acetylgalactosaminide beta-1,3-galactosyltransferase n=1 Tax=Polarella glacialis TaxID=89957 RepID=A0A813FIW0_POLGL|nr:unnamed protein product [Polarella glacialis]
MEANNEVQMLDRKDFTWLVVIDDDVYVNVDNLKRVLSSFDAKKKKVYGTPGCGFCGQKIGAGFCGGGGYMLSQDSLTSMAAQKENFTKEFNSEPNQEWSDVRFGCVAMAHGLELSSLPGLYPWRVPSDSEVIYSTEVPLLTLHYADPEDEEHSCNIFRIELSTGRIRSCQPG